MQILISAVEASGEMYGAQLIESLRGRDSSLSFFGVGGDRMRASGCDTVVDAKDLADAASDQAVRRRSCREAVEGGLRVGRVLHDPTLANPSIRSRDLATLGPAEGWQSGRMRRS